MTNALVATGSRLQKAIDKVKDLGLSLTVPDVQPMTRIIEKIADVDNDKAIIIARTLSAMQSFDTLVSENLSQTNYGDRFDDVSSGFNSIIEDLRRQVAQEEKGGPSVSDRIGNIYMKIRRGAVADRFTKIETIYKGVIKDSGKTLELQAAILEAYSDARLALKEGEIAASELFERVKSLDAAAKARLQELNARVEAAPADMSDSEKGRLELERDEALNASRKEDDRYQIAKDLSEMMTVSYSVTETVFGKYNQAHKVLERLHQKAVLFFDIQRPVMTAMKATYTGILVVNELGKTQRAMEDGINNSLEALATLGDSVLREGVKIAHGPAIKASSVAMLVDSVVEFQTFVGEATRESRQLSTVEAKAARDVVEAGKRKVAEFTAQAA